MSITTVGIIGAGTMGKKIALGVGVRSAKYPNVLVTDADCLPLIQPQSLRFDKVDAVLFFVGGTLGRVELKRHEAI